MKLFRFAIALAVILAAASPVWAALAPNHQRLAELRAILAHPGVVGAFGTAEPIERVEYISPDLYRVTAGHCQLDVAIVSKPAQPGIVGARQFDVQPGRRTCQ